MKTAMVTGDGRAFWTVCKPLKNCLMKFKDGFAVCLPYSEHLQKVVLTTTLYVENVLAPLNAPMFHFGD